MYVMFQTSMNVLKEVPTAHTTA